MILYQYCFHGHIGCCQQCWYTGMELCNVSVFGIKLEILKESTLVCYWGGTHISLWPLDPLEAPGSLSSPCSGWVCACYWGRRLLYPQPPGPLWSMIIHCYWSSMHYEDNISSPCSGWVCACCWGRRLLYPQPPDPLWPQGLQWSSDWRTRGGSRLQ